ICSELFGPTEQRYRIFTTVSTTATQRRLFVNADSAQEDRTSIQQNISAARFNAAETDLLMNLIRLRFDNHVVKFWIVGRPQLQICGEINRRRAARISCKRFTDSGFRNANRNSLIELVSTQLHPAGNTIARARLKLDDVIIHKALR